MRLGRRKSSSAYKRNGPGLVFKNGPLFGHIVSGLLVEEAAHFPASAWMLQLAQGLCLDLANTLAGNAELLANFLERVIGVHADAKTHTQNAFFTRSK